MDKKAASVIGIVLGVVMIIVGFCVQGISVASEPFASTGYTSIGSNIAFGGDFYTEIYAVTQDVGQAVNTANNNIRGAVNNAQQNICGAVEKVCDAIGWLIVVIGLFDVALFIGKMASCEEECSGNLYNTAPVAAPVYTAQSSVVTTSAPASAPVAAPAAPSAPVVVSEPVPNGWTCTCGRNHAPYEMSCTCGMTKAQAKLQSAQKD